MMPATLAKPSNVIGPEVLERMRRDLAATLRARTTILGGEERVAITPTDVAVLKQRGRRP